MPLYDGSPTIKIEGDKAKALGHIPDAKLLLQKTQRVAESAGVSTFSMSQRTDDGYIHALTANGVNSLFISANPEVVDKENEVVNEPLEKSSVNMLSGTVFNGSLSGNVLSSFAPTAQCRANYQGMPSGKQPSVRLSVRPWSGNSETASAETDSQYTNLKPSMYSGKMCAVVQAVMGLGRISISKLSNTPVGANSSTPKYLKEVKANGVQVRYDYKFHRTHGIYTGPDNVLWLVEIGINRGVIARPLPIVPKSRSTAFRDAAVSRGDGDVVAVYDALGCFPSGEAFPSTPTELQRALDRGDVIRLLSADDLKEFYKNSPYSTACGWAFSDDGSEAHNTAYGYESDTAVTQTGYHYQVNISIGPMQTSRSSGTPIASGSASIYIQSKAPLYGAGRIGKYLPIKFHEPLIGGLLSHDASPKEPTATPPLCDTTMMVCFDEGQLKTVKFYFNPQTDVVSETEDSRYLGECLFVGEWTITEKSGTRSIPRMMYTNDIDDRRVLVDFVRETNIKSRDIGFDPPRFGDFPSAPEYCFVFRERIFEQTTKVTATTGDGVGSVVVIPQNSRSAYYYMYATSTQEVITSTEVSFASIRDPNTAYGWRKFPRIGASPLSPECTDNRFVCGTTHTDRRVICTAYEPASPLGYGGVDGDCYQYADFGAWIKECDPIEVICSAQMNDSLPTHVGSSTSSYKGPTSKIALTLVSPGVGGQFPIPTPVNHYDAWTRPSPDPDTLEIQHISSSHSALGEDAVVYYTDLIGLGEQKFKGVSAATIGGSDNPTFIGVNGNG